jgi:hypothetical protein
MATLPRFALRKAHALATNGFIFAAPTGWSRQCPRKDVNTLLLFAAAVTQALTKMLEPLRLLNK